MTERWLPVPGYEGSYEVSDLGRVRSLPRRVNRTGTVTGQGVPERILAQTDHPKGYLYVTLYQGNRANKQRVHHLVLKAFVGPRPHGLEGCHNNGEYRDNRLTNLRWDTHDSNIQDAVAHGTHVNARKTHAPCGHPYDWLDAHGKRRCRSCLLKAKKQQYRKRKSSGEDRRMTD